MYLPAFSKRSIMSVLLYIFQIKQYNVTDTVGTPFWSYSLLSSQKYLLQVQFLFSSCTFKYFYYVIFEL